MYETRAPGVYFTRRRATPAIEPLRTDIAGFVGVTGRGPLHEPVPVDSWRAYVTAFGGASDQGYLSHSMKGFFDNGGDTCWVVRIANPATARTAALDLADVNGARSIRLWASSPGVWGNALRFRFVRTSFRRFTLIVRDAEGHEELWESLSLDQDDDRYIAKVFRFPSSDFGEQDSGFQDTDARSLLFRVSKATEAALPHHAVNAVEPLARPTVEARASGGSDGMSGLTAEHFEGGGLESAVGEDRDLEMRPWGLRALREVDEVSIVAAPDIMYMVPPAQAIRRPHPRCDLLLQDTWLEDLPVPIPELRRPFNTDNRNYLQRRLIAHCEELSDRIAVLDPHPDDVSPNQVALRAKAFTSGYGAFYFPWLLVGNQDGGRLSLVPPSGHVAGIYARVSRSKGPHQPPANEGLEGIADLRTAIDEVDHAYLNQSKVNVIRAHAGRGIRIGGARTLSSDTRWQYVNVRRLLIMLREAIESQIQWTVFEPNNPLLWQQIDRVVRSFLNGIWLRGMLDGKTADEAYQVICDETTNPPEETQQGRVICEIVVQPPWPAEYVVVRIGKTEAGVQFMEEGGLANA